MRTWLKRVRGLIGLGAAGAVVGGSAFGLITAVASFSAYGTVQGLGLLAAFLIGGFFGAATTTGFGLFLAITAKGRSVDELSLGRAMAIGALLCGGVVVTVSSLVRGTPAPASVALSQLLWFGGFGAVLTGSLLVIARRAARNELEGQGDRSREIEP